MVTKIVNASCISIFFKIKEKRKRIAAENDNYTEQSQTTKHYLAAKLVMNERVPRKIYSVELSELT